MFSFFGGVAIARFMDYVNDCANSNDGRGERQQSKRMPGISLAIIAIIRNN